MALVNPFGALGLDDTLQKIAQFLQQMANNLGRMYPDSSGRMRVNVETGNITANTGTIGGYQGSYDQYSQMQGNAAGIRAQIKVT